MPSFIERAASYTPTVPLSWLCNWQSDYRAHWGKLHFPKRKTEHWQYTNLHTLERAEVFTAAAEARPLHNLNAEALNIDGLDSIDLVFVNGHFNPALSSPASAYPEGLQLVRFSQADSEQQAQIRTTLESLARHSGRQRDKHLFATLNTAAFNEGVYIDVAKHCHIQRPVRVVTISQGQRQGCSVYPRLLLRAQPGAQLTLVEQFVSDGEVDNVFVNGLSELDLHPNASVHHYRLHLEDASALHIGAVHASLDRDAQLNSFHLALGARLKRTDIVVNHHGCGSHSTLNGIYLPQHKQQVDYHSNIEHSVPHTRSQQVFRGIISDQAKAVFNGRIHIHPQAQKTLAQLSNKNLLTSNQAEVDTKPELEIYADDVQCAHGATVAQLDALAMHYLQTRGISRQQAHTILSFGFINALLNNIKSPALADYLRPRLVPLFARDLPVTLRPLA